MAKQRDGCSCTANCPSCLLHLRVFYLLEHCQRCVASQSFRQSSCTLQANVVVKQATVHPGVVSIKVPRGTQRGSSPLFPMCHLSVVNDLLCSKASATACAPSSPMPLSSQLVCMDRARWCIVHIDCQPFMVRKLTRALSACCYASGPRRWLLHRRHQCWCAASWREGRERRKRRSTRSSLC